MENHKNLKARIFFFIFYYFLKRTKIFALRNKLDRDDTHFLLISELVRKETKIWRFSFFFKLIKWIVKLYKTITVFGYSWEF